MLLDPNGGGMALPDLRDLIETRIPEHRNQLEVSHTNLDHVATFCENNYLNAPDKNVAFEETKQYTLQSLASVAYQINTLARDLLDMLSLQTDKIDVLASNVENINMLVAIQKEKAARREIGGLTKSKSIPKEPKIISPHSQEPIPRYKRTPIDFSLLDGVGHGVRTEPQRPSLISRAPSTISTNNQYGGHYGQYERTANIGNNTLSRSSLRSGPLSLASSQNDHYRVPAVMPVLDPGRYSMGGNSGLQHHSEYGSHNISTPTSNIDVGSVHGSSEYGGTYMSDRYGTLRAHPQQRPIFDTVDRARSPTSPGLPPPPAAANNWRDFPPPSQMLNSTHEDEPLPPPPPASNNFFDVRPDWIPREGEYLEKCVALYDYDADKPDELSLRENCIVYVLRKNEDEWYEGVLDGVTGLFPGNYVRPI